MIIRVQKKLVLFSVIALIIISTPIVISKTGDYLKSRNNSPGTVETSSNRPPRGSCGSSSNCGCGCGGPGTTKPKTKVDIDQTGNKIKDAENAGYKYYVDRYGDPDVKVVARDYGCHVEVEILKNNQVVKKLGYSNGSIYE